MRILGLRSDEVRATIGPVLSGRAFAAQEPVAQRIWTPPPGHDPLAYMGSLSRIWNPLKTSVVKP